MKVQEVSVSPITKPMSGELSEKTFCTCSFCGKSVMVSSVSRRLCQKLSPAGVFFCQFCLRQRHDKRSSRHILILSFRSLIGHYYGSLYKTKGLRQTKGLFISQIEDYVESHEKAGLTNPAFSYDPESYLWFVDFEKIGKGKRKLPLEEVYRTVITILSCFNLAETCPGIRMHKLYEKYREAIDSFYTNRSRPPDRRILSPTLTGCGVTETKESLFEKTREFSPRDLVP